MPTGDCERLVDGFLMQPVNAVSSLAFVVVGIWVVVATRARSSGQRLPTSMLGLALVLVGLGSFAFHGPGGPVAGWAHDVAISSLLLLILARELGYRVGWSTRQNVVGWAGAALGVAALGAAWPRVIDPLNALLALLAVVSVVGSRPAGRRPREDRSTNRHPGELAGAMVLALGAAVMLLSRTGGPLCAPEAVVQGHAVWHLLAAIGVGIYGLTGPTRIDRAVRAPL